MLDIECAGWRMTLLSSGAVYLSDIATLLVADAHFGKAVSFRLRGVPVPQGTTTETLQRLTDALAQTSAARIIFLGDFLHSAEAHAAPTQLAIAKWRSQHADLDLTLVRGNHDDRAGDPPLSLGIEVLDEPFFVPGGAMPLALCHYPQRVAGTYVLAGHTHPCVVLKGAGRERLRLPCFVLGNAATRAFGTLPAFGSFTGMHPIERHSADRVFAVAGPVVREVPAAATAN
jgi:uncharacterized protein